MQCRITHKPKPEVWIEIEIGVDDKDQPFRKLLRTSSVSFHEFGAKAGVWAYTRFIDVDRNGRRTESNGITVRAGDSDGFVLGNLPKVFYRLNCGQSHSGKGMRLAAGADLLDSMEILCV